MLSYVLSRATSVRSSLAFAALVASGCIDWDVLYGKECAGELIAAGQECIVPTCGDGIVNEGEECDDANENDTDGCLSTCVSARCGDGLLLAVTEDCDDGNTESGDGCSDRCRKEDICGDGEISGAEQCDDGGVEEGDGCSSECLNEPDPVLCGNGELDENEICDDGNSDSEDSCLAGCTWSSCGDGVQRQGVELCEDGNSQNGDGCTRSCLVCGEEGTRHRIGNDHCYVLHDEATTYSEARHECARAGGYLWTGTSAGEVNEIKRRLIEDEREVWIGRFKTSGEWGWITGETSNYSPWVEGFPTGQDCTVQFGTAEADANFRNRSCGINRPYVCEFEPALIDPVSHVAYRRFFQKKSFLEAGKACQEIAGQLVSFESVEEASLVLGEFRNEVWIGASKQLAGDFEWLTGSSLTEELVDGADLSGDGDCLSASATELIPASCDEQLGYICEFF